MKKKREFFIRVIVLILALIGLNTILQTLMVPLRRTGLSEEISRLIVTVIFYGIGGLGIYWLVLALPSADIKKWVSGLKPCFMPFSGRLCVWRSSSGMLVDIPLLSGRGIFLHVGVILFGFIIFIAAVFISIKLSPGRLVLFCYSLIVVVALAGFFVTKSVDFVIGILLVLPVLLWLDLLIWRRKCVKNMRPDIKQVEI